MSSRHVIGIDLGTTNCSLAFARAGGVADPHDLPLVELFSIPQLTNPGEVREEPLLPSFLYLPGPADFPAGTIDLPWTDGAGSTVAGVLAQRRGAESPARLIASAKSWLSWSGVDRGAPILPVNAQAGVEKLSPVAVSREYLLHLRRAWDHKNPDAPFDEQEVFVTVPASCDAVARELTPEAAQQAG